MPKIDSLLACLVRSKEVQSRIKSISAAKLSTQLFRYRNILKTIEFIDVNLGSDLDIEELAKIAAMAVTPFKKHFHEALGITPYQYLRERRITFAKQLLAKTDIPITEICFEVGYSSAASFSTLFRKFTNLTATEYRNLHRKRHLKE